METQPIFRKARTEKPEICIEENGGKAKSMAKESKTGLMEQSLRVSICSTKSMEKELYILQMDLDTLESSKKE